jgi:hypothetical protein
MLQNAVMWKMVSSYLMWCVLRERNDRSFEDCEQTVEELTDFFFQDSLSLGASALDLNISSCHVFLGLFSSRVASFWFLTKLRLLIKESKTSLEVIIDI